MVSAFFNLSICFCFVGILPKKSGVQSYHGNESAGNKSAQDRGEAEPFIHKPASPPAGVPESLAPVSNERIGQDGHDPSDQIKIEPIEADVIPR